MFFIALIALKICKKGHTISSESSDSYFIHFNYLMNSKFKCQVSLMLDFDIQMNNIDAKLQTN